MAKMTAPKPGERGMPKKPNDAPTYGKAPSGRAPAPKAPPPPKKPMPPTARSAGSTGMLPGNPPRPGKMPTPPTKGYPAPAPSYYKPVASKSALDQDEDSGMTTRKNPGQAGRIGPTSPGSRTTK